MLVANRKQAFAPMPRRQQQQEERAHRRVKKRTSLVTKYAQVALVMFLAALAVSVIAHYTIIVGVSYQAGRLQREYSSLKEEQHHLKLDIARLTSLERIEAIAKNELGLVYPDAEQYIFLTLKR